MDAWGGETNGDIVERLVMTSLDRRKLLKISGLGLAGGLILPFAAVDPADANPLLIEGIKRAVMWLAVTVLEAGVAKWAVDHIWSAPTAQTLSPQSHHDVFKDAHVIQVHIPTTKTKFNYYYEHRLHSRTDSEGPPQNHKDVNRHEIHGICRVDGSAAHRNRVKLLSTQLNPQAHAYPCTERLHPTAQDDHTNVRRTWEDNFRHTAEHYGWDYKQLEHLYARHFSNGTDSTVAYMVRKGNDSQLMWPACSPGSCGKKNCSYVFPYERPMA